MRREDIERFSRISGEDGMHTPFDRMDAYLDGYNKATTEMDRLRSDLAYRKFSARDLNEWQEGVNTGIALALEMIDTYKLEMVK